MDVWHIEWFNETLLATQEGTGPFKFFSRSGEPYRFSPRKESEVPFVDGIEQDTAHLFVSANPSLKPKFTRSKHKPGHYFPRIYRESQKYIKPDPEESRQIASSVRAARAVLQSLESVFMVLDPDERNDKAFGHQLRQILILASTEVESCWSAVLKANHYPELDAKGKGWRTNDYVKLLEPMRLAEWQVALAWSDYPPFKPFEGWSPACPSKSLPWYRDYNQTKHDREAYLHLATLHNAVRAAGAVVVMGLAQFGPYRTNGLLTSAIGVPEWPKQPIEDDYITPKIVPGVTWTPKDCTF